MENRSVFTSPALSFAFFGILRSPHCSGSYFSIRYHEVRIFSWNSQFPSSCDPNRTIWLSVKLAFALSLKESDIVECVFQSVDHPDLEREALLLVGILPAAYDSRHVYATRLCIFNLFRGANVIEDSLILKTVKLPRELPGFAHSASIALLKSSCHEDFAADESIQKYFDCSRLVSVGDVFPIECFDSKLCRDRKLFFKVTRLDGAEGSKTALISQEKTSVSQSATECGHIPAESPRLPSTLKKQCERMRLLIEAKLRCPQNDLLRILLYGRYGAGHRHIVSSLGAFFSVNVLFFDCIDFWSEAAGTSIAKIQAIFQKIESFGGYCIVVFENADVIGAEVSTENRDERVLHCFEMCLEKHLVYSFIFTCETSALNSLSPGFRLLFLYEFEIPPLKESDRIELLSAEVPSLKADEIHIIAQQTNGFLFSELHTLISDARFCQFVGNQKVLSMDHFREGIDLRNKSFARLIGVPKIPVLKYDDIGGLTEAKRILRESLQMMVAEKRLKRSGIVLYGPPGCGKTLLAKAAASQFKFTLLNVKGPELINKYVGQSEANVRKVFEQARHAAPCMIFFDELDSLAPNRGRSGDSGGVADRIVSQLLAELDDLSDASVFVLGATNRLDLLDPSLLRPGRFDKTILVEGGRDVDSRLSILQAASRNVTFSDDVDLREMAELTESWMSGADLHSVISRGVLDAMRTRIEELESGFASQSEPLIVTRENLLAAVSQVSSTCSSLSHTQPATTPIR